MSHDSSSIKIEVYSNGKTHRLLKLIFFINKCAGILLTSIYITQWLLATPTLIGTWSYELRLEFYLDHSHMYCTVGIVVARAAGFGSNFVLGVLAVSLLVTTLRYQTAQTE